MTVQLLTDENSHVKWFRKNAGAFKTLKSRTGIVMNVHPRAIHARWLSCRDPKGELPCTVCDPSELRVVHNFSHCHWSPGDSAILTPERLAEIKEQAKTKPENIRQQWEAVIAAVEAAMQKFANKNEVLPEGVIDLSPYCLPVLRTNTFVHVTWQDGSQSDHVPSLELIPVTSNLANDFWPEDWVLPKPMPGAEKKDERVGLIRKVNTRERIALVRWYRPATPEEREQDRKQYREDGEEEVPIYSLLEHPEWTYRVGYYVIRLPTEHEEGPTDGWVGEVISVQNGRIIVAWNDGSRSECGPEELHPIDLEDLEDYFDSAGLIGLEEEEEEEEEEPEESYEEEEEESWEDVEQVPIEAALAESQRESTEKPSAEEPAAKAPEKPAAPPEEKAPAKPGEAAPPEVHAPPVPKGELSLLPAEQFPQFAVLETAPPTHHYLQQMMSQSAKWTSRVIKEWDSLRKNLPPGIYVRTYENRMDLLSVLIIGPASTPFYDNLFLFDIHLPSEYPNVPPQAFYLSQVPERLNPNLYETGRQTADFAAELTVVRTVSLLGTWSGRGSENWDAAHSSLLQLFVSIQGLILVPKPYFLEAGYDKQQGTASGEKLSRLYNENSFLLSLQSMELIMYHFHSRRDGILSRCQRYLKIFEEKTEVNEAEDPCGLACPPSSGFIKMLQTLLPRLSDTLSSVTLPKVEDPKL